jgi:hypothetical protein
MARFADEMRTTLGLIRFYDADWVAWQQAPTNRQSKVEPRSHFEVSVKGARGLLEGFDRSFPKHGARAMSGWACPGRRGSITVTYLPPSAPLSTVLNGPN